jgi:hypothetical protein
VGASPSLDGLHVPRKSEDSKFALAAIEVTPLDGETFALLGICLPSEAAEDLLKKLNG